MTKNDVFEGFEDDGFELPQDEKWNYPGMGYNSREGVVYVDSDQVRELVIIPFALRQCKEVTDGNEIVHRYPIYHKKHEMVTGKVTYRTQMIVMVDGELYTFGSRSFVANLAMNNPPEGKSYHNDDFPVGLWPKVLQTIKDTKSIQGVKTAPYCWAIKIAPSNKQVLVGSTHKQKVYPLLSAPEYKFIGKEAAYKNRDLYNEEDLDGWVSEWKQVAQEAYQGETGAIGATEDDLSDFPGFELE